MRKEVRHKILLDAAGEGTFVTTRSTWLRALDFSETNTLLLFQIGLFTMYSHPTGKIRLDLAGEIKEGMTITVMCWCASGGVKGRIVWLECEEEC